MLKFDNGHSFSYEMIGEFRGEKGWIHPERIIKSTELILVLEGEVYVEEEGKCYTLLPDDIIVLEPDKKHRGFKPSAVPTAFYWFHFHTDIPVPVKTCTSCEIYDLKKQLKRLLHVTNTTGYSENYIDGVAYLCFEEFLRLQTQNSVSNSVLVNNIKEYIRINLEKDPTVGEISAHFGYNPDYIGKLFKSSEGVGLKEYIAAGKMKRAKDMLLTTSKTVKQIALHIGFSEENCFLKFFRYHEGCSPTVYRKKYTNTHINNK